MDQGDSYEDCFAYGPFYFKELLTFIVQVCGQRIKFDVCSFL
jgi:hypothetical protein